MKAALLGASRGCGLATLSLLVNHTDWDLHVLLRDASALDSHTFPASRVHVFEGDALSSSSVASFLSSCGQDLDYVVSSLGGKPVFDPWRPLAPVKFPKGQENICFDSIKVLLDALGHRQGTQPKLVVVSSNAIGTSTHSKLPWALKPLYGRLLKLAHADKHRMEVFLHQTYGLASDDFNPSPCPAPKWPFSASDLCIVRPSLLTDGEARGVSAVRHSTVAAKKGEEEHLTSAWTISRRDVGEFIVARILGVGKGELDDVKGASQPSFFGRGIVISY